MPDSPQHPPANDPNTQAYIKTLEEEVASLRSELATLRAFAGWLEHQVNKMMAALLECKRKHKRLKQHLLKRDDNE